MKKQTSRNAQVLAKFTRQSTRCQPPSPVPACLTYQEQGTAMTGRETSQNCPNSSSDAKGSRTHPFIFKSPSPKLDPVSFCRSQN